MSIGVFKISVYSLKPQFQRFLWPVAQALIKAHITPNFITVTACLLSALYGGLLLALGFPSALLWGMSFFLFMRMALNALDGMIAIRTLQTSNRGAFLNELCDIFSDLALYLPFAWHVSLPSPFIVALLFGSLISEFIGLASLATGQARRFEGPFGKSDRAVFFGLLALIIALCPSYPGLQQALPWVCTAALFLCAWTILNRFTIAWKSL